MIGITGAGKPNILLIAFLTGSVISGPKLSKGEITMLCPGYIFKI